MASATSFAQSAKSSLTDPEQAAMFNRVSDKLVCQCGCNMILRVCNHFECPSALPMRAEIEEKILAGAAEDAIVTDFVEEHGKVVLATPSAKGIDLAAWVMPGFVVLMGLFLLLYFVSDWLAKKKVKPAASQQQLDSGTMSRIEDELSRLDT
ncbi:MAG: cytochrome c-type biogenesis protein CcmH [Candidatus Krumholzibacteria bacterium]|nr:cytochrome c-type biogenesis protein CcmH [Candidatus Krumholzibacteria bacterium]